MQTYSQSGTQLCMLNSSAADLQFYQHLFAIIVLASVSSPSECRFTCRFERH